MAEQWPDGLDLDPMGAWPGALASDRRASPFRAGIADTLQLLEREISHLKGKNMRLQIALQPAQFRLDGKPRAHVDPEHPGVILTLQSKHGALSYPCDTFTRWQDNLRAIALALEALRKVDRYGVTKRGEQYRGFLALEGGTAMPAAFTAETAVELITEISRRSPSAVVRDLAAKARVAKRLTHPDHGGDPAEFDRVMRAIAVLEREGLL